MSSNSMFEDRLRALLAEDETIIRLDLEQMLEENGMDVVGERSRLTAFLPLLKHCHFTF